MRRFFRSRHKMEPPPARRMCPDCGCATKIDRDERHGIDCWFCGEQLERPAVRRHENPINRYLARFR